MSRRGSAAAQTERERSEVKSPEKKENHEETRESQGDPTAQIKSIKLSDDLRLASSLGGIL